MKISLVAERYAKALFDLAIEQHQLESVYRDAGELARVCAENRDLVIVLKSPVINGEKKVRILNDLFEKEFNKITLTFLLILTRKGREAYIPEIAEDLVERYKKYKNIQVVHLTTAVPATETIRDQVKEIMKEHTRAHVELIEKIDPSIIGGFVLSWGDMHYDASIRYQIERIRKGSARVNLYKKGF